jgi:DNA-binding GntR family transcriptional regulator
MIAKPVHQVRIERVSVADQVFDYMRSSIVSGALPQGSRVVESQIAKTLDVSRAPVREAVNRLLQEGLLETKTHFGPSVTTMTRAKIHKLYSVRVAIETLAIRDVANKRPETALAELERLIAEMQICASTNDFLSLVECELAFHQMILNASDNPYVQQIGQMIDGQMRMALAIDNATYASLEEVANEHKPLVDAIIRGDATGAAKLMEIHIMSSLGDADDNSTNYGRLVAVLA